MTSTDSTSTDSTSTDSTSTAKLLTGTPAIASLTTATATWVASSPRDDSVLVAALRGIHPSHRGAAQSAVMLAGAISDMPDMIAFNTIAANLPAPTASRVVARLADAEHDEIRAAFSAAVSAVEVPRPAGTDEGLWDTAVGALRERTVAAIADAPRGGHTERKSLAEMLADGDIKLGHVLEHGTHKAKVLSADSVQYGGKSYSSLSAAACAASGKKTQNGHIYWGTVKLADRG